MQFFLDKMASSDSGSSVSSAEIGNSIFQRAETFSKEFVDKVIEEKSLNLNETDKKNVMEAMKDFFMDIAVEELRKMNAEK